VSRRAGRPATCRGYSVSPRHPHVGLNWPSQHFARPPAHGIAQGAQEDVYAFVSVDELERLLAALGIS
jgi:hypothetical protein